MRHWQRSTCNEPTSHIPARRPLGLVLIASDASGGEGVDGVKDIEGCLQNPDDQPHGFRHHRLSFVRIAHRVTCVQAGHTAIRVVSGGERLVAANLCPSGFATA